MGEKQLAEYKIAEQNILKGVRITEELNIKPWCALGHLSLGELYINMGMRDMAYKHFTKAETMYQDMGIEYWKSIATKALTNLKALKSRPGRGDALNYLTLRPKLISPHNAAKQWWL